MRPQESFICDAMLGGLARWLRAAGYSAYFDVHIRDGELVRRALQEGRCLLTSDSGILERYAVARNLVECAFVPLGLSSVEQLACVMAARSLQRRQPRCMDCDGELLQVSLAQVEDLVPPKVKALCREFFRCSGCGKVYWHGTHWASIQARLSRAEELARSRFGGAPDVPMPRGRRSNGASARS